MMTGWRKIRDLGSNRVLAGLHVSPVTRVEIEKDNQETEQSPCLPDYLQKHIFG